MMLTSHRSQSDDRMLLRVGSAYLLAGALAASLYAAPPLATAARAGEGVQQTPMADTPSPAAQPCRDAKLEKKIAKVKRKIQKLKDQNAPQATIDKYEAQLQRLEGGC
jgi:septal ring factor EnvC (AmiA/AmiB activator)